MSLKPNSKANFRKQHYKVAVDGVEARRRREESMVEIRKSKREESLLKKRKEGVPLDPSSQPSRGYHQTETISVDEKAIFLQLLENLPAAVSALASDDVQAKNGAVIHLRKILSNENINPPIDEVIQSGVVPVLVDMLERDNPQLQFEAAWVLTNITSGTSEHTKVVIDNGALPIFVKLLSSLNDNVREQAIWALGNIGGDSPEYRDLVLGHGALKQVLAQFNQTASISMIRNATWTLSNLCRRKPYPQFDHVRNALPTLQYLIHMSDDEILIDACWAISCLSEGSNLKIQAVIDAGICPKLVELLSYSSPLVVIPSLRALGNIVSGDDAQTQVVIDNQALPRILHLLTAEQTKNSIIRGLCWTISNITAGTKEQIQAVINANIFPPLLSLLANAEFDIKKEVAWAVSNATLGGTDEQIKYLVDQGCIQPVCDLLTCSDVTIVIVCLNSVENILRVGETEQNAGLTDVNVYANLIEDAGGLDSIEALQNHQNTEVYLKAVRIIENYLADEDDDV